MHARACALATWALLVFIVMGLSTSDCGSGSGSSTNPANLTSPTSPPPAVTEVRVTSSTLLTTAGQTTQLVATASLSNGATETVSSSAAWQSSNPGVATVSASGVVQSVAPGTTTITATYQGVSGTVQISWSYTIDPSPYLRIETGSLPVVISAPHGGSSSVPGVPERSTGVTATDTNTLELATSTQAALASRTGQRASLVAALVSRRYVDFNVSRGNAFESASLASLYDAYYVALSTAAETARRSAGQGAILVDIHGQSENVRVVFRGTRNGQTASLPFLYGQPGGLLARLLALNVAVDPSTASGTEHPSFNGGNIVAASVRFGGGIHAVQLEFGFSYRQPSSALADTASKLADAIASAANCATCR
jgi:N-formylglutamate amidohydrolase